MEKFTEFLSAATQFLFLDHRYRTSIGIVLGVSMAFLLSLSSVFIEQYVPLVKDAVAWYLGFTVLGMLIAHAPNLRRLSQTDNVLDENLQKSLDLIAEAERRGVSKRDIQRMYRDLAQRYVERSVLNQQTQEEIAKVVRSLRDLRDMDTR